MAEDDHLENGWNWQVEKAKWKIAAFDNFFGKFLELPTWKMAGADFLENGYTWPLENGWNWQLKPNGNWPPWKQLDYHLKHGLSLPSRKSLWQNT
jgi:hypothetical protein